MKSFRKLLQYLKPYMFFAIIGPLFMVLEVAMDLIQPTIMQHIIDVGIANRDLNYVIKMGLLMIGAAALGLVGGLGCMMYSTKAAVNFATDIRKDVFAKIETFSSNNRDSFGTGKLLTIVTNDITSIQSAMTMTLRVLVRGPLLFMGSIIIVFVTARGLFPILLVVVPILLLAIILIASKASGTFKKVQEALDKVNTKLQENLSGVRVIKAYVRQKYEIAQFGSVNTNLTKINIRAVQLISLMMPIIMLVVSGGIVATLWIGGEKVFNGTLQVGAILAFINYLNIILMSLMSISMVFIQIARAFPSADRVQQVLNTEVDIISAANAIEPEKIEGNIEFKNVSYSYTKNNEYVLKDISFSIQKGEKVGIIGSTGSGKSTLAKLLPRLYDVDQGEICIDGIDVKTYDLQKLRASIGFVPQKALLFSGSIEENLRYGKENATHDELEVAAASACATEFINKLEESYRYNLTQGATNLSGGQKQRVSIARALVRKPPILILDDSTSAVDAKSEATIQTALKTKYKGTTTLLIASKISSIMDADKILVLDNGELVGNGTHEQLLERSEVYQEIYLSQGGNLHKEGGEEHA
ncbi:TPA: ABC transporter ATP-binding protein [Bacillus thuringiensis]|uniref:Multidrug ABC transporter ATP-binding protein n=3 Tax=Bacillus cereus group TaxID=86661 RepID=A0A9X6KV04_BACTU|nr:MULTISPECIES: ABC transporter ATP-binding protein [Bacillus cereus group]AGE78234.1 ABC transporter, permease/ATP-binding protein [Bacillus thuringiensis serovar kurstaki str. HD73]AHZ51294.1 ABC transporter ATP-binding protein/permease [Bacillus thuringiensis serovar kurstaki str. YBT-1520]AIE33708.1 ABC transporter ATP-binding protein/permease [Bacillus thuringiensis serovar kurstaki str. HD-1]AIM32004.1 ABC transporter, permease/ATP-binding protein [Bacillus thuringiensis serovar kurstaki